VIQNAPLPVQTLALKGRTLVAERTMEFRFEKPRQMTFKAGQYLDLTLLFPPETNEEGDTRSFSIASAPDDEDLAIVTRLRDSAFKRSLQSIPLGTGVQAEGPYGDFSLHHDPDRPAVLLAGGIGVTPFRSMVRQNAHRGGSRRILLFHSSRRPEDAAFLGELREFARDNPNFTFVPTMSRPETSRLPWEGEIGRIEYDLISKHLREAAFEDAAKTPMFYIAGPPRMVADLRQMLSDAGVGDDDVRIEEFTGY
jgi:ferredoxin-NADP reductase